MNRSLAQVLLFCLILAPAQAGSSEVFTESLLAEWRWRMIGPSAPAGRSWTVIGVDADPKTLYATSAGGGLWKSKNHGVTFENVFAQGPVAATGAVAVALSDKNTVWLGTGENANTRASSWGNGVYKSSDGAKTWTHMGLEKSYHIAHIVIHPSNPKIVWVAAMGYLWGANEQRGIFKTSDGGLTWKKVLYLDETTGANDLQIDPNNPNILYPAMWQRYRYGGGDMDEAGPKSGIFKSEDGGETWTRQKQGLPTDDLAKIHLAVAHSNSQIVYASILAGEPRHRPRGRTSSQGGIYRSEDGGRNWTLKHTSQSGYYYTHIHVDPNNDNTLWFPLLELYRSTDGGTTLVKQNMRNVHFDLHSIWVDPNDSDHLVLSGDGGVSVSHDGSKTWMATVLPIGQFYEVSVDNQDPYFVIGGMQDTASWLGPSRTYDDEGITSHDWFKLRFDGDGMDSATDPRDPNFIYMVLQYGGTSRIDLRTWDRVEYKPRAEALKAKGADHPIRWDWNPAFVLSRHDPDIFYLGCNYLMRVNASDGTWDLISPDLSWQQERTLVGVKDGRHGYGALFSVAESHTDPQTLWAGADDGPIWLTRDGGKSWAQIDGNIKDGPANCFVAEIEVSRFVEGRAYVAMNCHTKFDLNPYVYVTEDFGRNWCKISSDLPKGSSYVVREDPVNPNVLYAGVEFGLYVSINQGGHWVKLQNNLATACIRGMAIQERDKELVVGTFGHANWVTDIAPFAEMSQEMLARPLHLFQTKRATRFKRRVTYGNTIEELNGDNFFRGANPPCGTEVVYYLKREGEQVDIRIMDEKGRVVRHLSGPGGAGIHRVVWDLQRDKDKKTTTRPRRVTGSEQAYAREVPVGKYRVEIEAGRNRDSGSVIVRAEPAGGVKQVRPRL